MLVKCLEEREPFSTWHKIAVQANNHTAPNPELHSGVPRAPWTRAVLDGLYFLSKDPLLLSGIKLVCHFPKGTLGAFRNNSLTMREEIEKLLITDMRTKTKYQFGAICLGANNLSCLNKHLDSYSTVPCPKMVGNYSFSLTTQRRQCVDFISSQMVKL